MGSSSEGAMVKPNVYMQDVKADYANHPGLCKEDNVIHKARTALLNNRESKDSKGLVEQIRESTPDRGSCVIAPCPLCPAGRIAPSVVIMTHAIETGQRQEAMGLRFMVHN
jgi:hypothetical protein